MSIRHRMLAAATIGLILLTGCGRTESAGQSVLQLTATSQAILAETQPPATLTQPPRPTAGASPVPTNTPAPTEALSPMATLLPLPRFERSRCLFEYSYPQYTVLCGYLIVPEDRYQPRGPTIKLHVAVFQSKSAESRPDPVIYLAGGGGANPLDSATYYLHNIGDDILETRDLIIYNQRGTRYGEPWLDCPGYTPFLKRLASRNLSREVQDALTTEFLLRCRDDLIEKGINLTAYNTAANAADVNDLRIALGYDQVNLYGTSYGTKLALTVMRDYPEAVRSAIIDSVFPPQVDYYSHFARNAHRAFSTFFEECATDLYCGHTYPDLEAVFYQIVDELQANPIKIPSRQGTLFVDGGDFMNVIYSSLYYADRINFIPLMIYRARAGMFGFMGDLFTVSDQDHISWGTHYSVACHDDAAFETYEEAVALAADLPPQITNYYVSPFIFTLCESWQAGMAEPVDNEPVISEIPTLVLAGHYDPITPPAWGQLAAETLSNSFYYEFPNRGHGVMLSDRCGLQIGLQFLDDPTTEPDAACLGIPSASELE